MTPPRPNSLNNHFSTSLAQPHARNGKNNRPPYRGKIIQNRKNMSKTVKDHLRDGTFRPDRHKVYTPAGALLRELPPPPPDVLSPEAEIIYTETGNCLIEQKTLKVTDLQTLTIYAGEVATCHEMARELRREGLTIICNNGIETVNPKRKIQETALRNSSILADRLGLNPASRTKMRGSSAFQDEQPVKVDPILELMKKSKKQ